MTKRPQLGWRLPNADTNLYAPLFQFAYQEEMHVKVHGQQEIKWAQFTEKLFSLHSWFRVRGDQKEEKNSIRYDTFTRRNFFTVC